MNEKQKDALAKRTIKLGAIIFLFVILSSIGACLFTHQTDFWFVLMMVISAIFCFAKIYFAMTILSKWMVAKQSTILGLPTPLFFLYIILGGLLYKLTILSQEMSADWFSAPIRIQVFVFSMSLALLGTLILWYGGLKTWMSLPSEYDARMEFKTAGATDAEIERKIFLLKERQIF